MGDILVLMGSDADAGKARRLLIDRPGLDGHTVHQYDQSWGSVIAQQSAGRWYAPAIDQRRTIFVVGRPVVRGVELTGGPDALGQWILDTLGDRSLDEGASDVNAQLSGMYAIFEIAADRLCVLTDHLGFRPVYVARDGQGELLGIGTHVESLAHATGMQADIDLVSLGELFTYSHISFPFTTRHAIRELDPCSVTKFSFADRVDEKSRVLWEPTEPDVFVGEAEIRQQLREALLEAGDDLTRGCECAAVLLSGGVDSRAVIGVIPKDRISGALTYVTRENRETKVAGEVARACDVEQVFVQRGDDYFPSMIERGLGLIGMELRGNCHGLCIADAKLAGQYDVVIGGQLSDTLLKAHYMPLPKRAKYEKKTMKSRLRTLVKGPMPEPVPSQNHTTGREALEASLTDDIRQAVRDRRSKRFEEVQRVRPTTADEWHRFWPCSRQDDSAHTLGNARMMCSDTLFAHQAIVEVSAGFDPRYRVGGRLTDSVFADVCGDLMHIMNANTGLPADASARAVRVKRQRDRLGLEKIKSKERSKDWNQVETSWVNPVVMQKESVIWIGLREQLVSSDAMGVLSKVIDRSGETMIESYQDDLPSTSNHMAMQLAIWLDGILSVNSSEISEAVQ